MLGREGFRRLAYAEWGPSNAARTDVCLHGLSRSGRAFDTLASAMAEQGERAVPPALPERGCGEWLESLVHYTDCAYTRAMSALIARLDVEQVDRVGTSLARHVGIMPAARAGEVTTVQIVGCGHAPALMNDAQVAVVQAFVS